MILARVLTLLSLAMAHVSACKLFCGWTSDPFSIFAFAMASTVLAAKLFGLIVEWWEL